MGVGVGVAVPSSPPRDAPGIETSGVEGRTAAPGMDINGFVSYRLVSIVSIGSLFVSIACIIWIIFIVKVLLFKCIICRAGNLYGWCRIVSVGINCIDRITVLILVGIDRTHCIMFGIINRVGVTA